MEKKKLKISNRGKLTILGLLSVILIVVGVFVVYPMLSNDTKPSDDVEDPVIATKDYLQAKDPTDLQEEVYTAFQTALDENQVTKIQEYVAVNFIVDFFTWSNIEGREKIGGISYVLPDIRSNVALQAIDQYYVNFEEFKSKYKLSGLPEVDSYQVISVNDSSYRLEALPNAPTKDITIGWTYKKKSDGMAVDGLKNKAVVTIILLEDKYYVVALDYTK